MPFQYSCFVSYRHIQGELSERFIDELRKALESYVSPWVNSLDLGIYVSKERMEGGDHITPALERAICESICMILVYTPDYFDKRHPFCAREYKSMKELERERIKDNQHSLIIPIIFRGKMDALPKELKADLHAYDFSKFTLSPEDVNIQSNKNYVEVLNKIGERVRYLYDLMSAETDPCENCDDFHLATEADVKDLIEEAQYIRYFPGRRS